MSILFVSVLLVSVCFQLTTPTFLCDLISSTDISSLRSQGELMGWICDANGKPLSTPEYTVCGYDESGIYPWSGITCDNNEIISINLLTKSISGTIPSSIATLRHLVSLNLGNNYFYGTIPIAISNITTLKVLMLYNNHLTGELPSNFGVLLDLETLDVSYNYLDGSIPTTYGQLHRLNYFDISGNSMWTYFPSQLSSLKRLQYFLGNSISYGSLSTSIGELLSLKKFSFSSSGIFGTIPTTLGNLRQLDYLSLSHNSLNGSIPSSFGYLLKLSTLDLIYNRLVEIPTAICKMRNLQYLYLTSNSLISTLPSSIGSLSRLMELYLDQNLFSGTIPSSFSYLQNLVDLSLYNNKFSGPFSQSFISSHLKYLNLKSNNFNDSLPILTSCSSLNYLDVSYNKFSGFLSAITNITTLSFLSIYSNSIQGSIPSSLGSSTNLYSLLLGNNLLSGTIPFQIFSFFYMTTISLEHNHFSGTIGSLGSCYYLQSLTCQSNSLSGHLSSISSCNSLSSVLLYDNAFTGSSLVGMSSNLAVLDVHNCYLTGDFPSLVAQGAWNSLTYLDVSMNSLTGNISSIYFNYLPNIVSLFLEENLINGPIFNYLFYYLGSLKYLNLSHNSISGVYPYGINSNSLIEIDMSYNPLKMNISFLAFQLPSCTTFRWKHCNLTQSLPVEIYSLTSLLILDLSVNEIYGTLSSAVSNLASIEQLLLYRNSFSGSIPVELSSCVQLTTLELQHNDFNGTLPWTFLSSLSKLSTLELSFNQLSGRFPSVNGLQDLSTLAISHNMFSRKLLSISSSNILWNLTYVDVSHNRIANCSLPNWILQGIIWGRLSYVDVSHNRFNTSVTNLFNSRNKSVEGDSLVYLDMSHNHLVGSIPWNFSYFNRLQYLDVSYNFITGSLPTILCDSSLNISFFSIQNNHLLCISSCLSSISFDFSSDSVIDCEALAPSSFPSSSPTFSPSSQPSSYPSAAPTYIRYDNQFAQEVDIVYDYKFPFEVCQGDVVFYPVSNLSAVMSFSLVFCEQRLAQYRFPLPISWNLQFLNVSNSRGYLVGHSYAHSSYSMVNFQSNWSFDINEWKSLAITNTIIDNIRENLVDCPSFLQSSSVGNTTSNVSTTLSTLKIFPIANDDSWPTGRLSMFQSINIPWSIFFNNTSWLNWRDVDLVSYLVSHISKTIILQKGALAPSSTFDIVSSYPDLTVNSVGCSDNDTSLIDSYCSFNNAFNNSHYYNSSSASFRNQASMGWSVLDVTDLVICMLQSPSYLQYFNRSLNSSIVSWNSFSLNIVWKSTKGVSEWMTSHSSSPPRFIIYLNSTSG